MSLFSHQGTEETRRTLTVSALTALLRRRLEDEFPDVWVEGEISTLRAPSSGHLYFVLKDAQSQLRAVLFRSAAQRLRFAVQDGLQVVVHGRLTVYEPRGEYQIVLDTVEPKGLGALQLAFEQLKAKLAAEGLFDPARKKPLPFLPTRVGLVTSPTGAAVRDMLVVLGRRCPTLDVLIYPVPVQGSEAAERIAEGLRTLGRSGLVDVIIVGRGGGSWEDLWCFNEEVVVRAIAASPVPVVSAVGHEIDVTLADFVADYRAPTPSAAAEAVAPVWAELVQGVQDLTARHARAVQRRCVALRQEVAQARRVFATVAVPLERRAQRLDDMTLRLREALEGLATDRGRRWQAARHALELFNPGERVRAHLALVPQLRARVEQRIAAVLALRRQTFRTVLGTLDSLSPLAILGRGYSILQRVSDGTVVRRAADVAAGASLRATLAEGRLLCTVRETQPGNRSS